MIERQVYTFRRDMGHLSHISGKGHPEQGRSVIELRPERRQMLKVVVFDSGYGGEFLADRLEEELPILGVERVIDWRNAEKILLSARSARKVAEEDLAPHIGKVDLIVFANHLLTITSLKYFQKKYPNQKFSGLFLKKPDTFKKRDTLILTTRAVTRTMGYQMFVMGMGRKTRTLAVDEWPSKIDDGNLDPKEIENTLKKVTRHSNFHPQEVVLACAQFDDIKSDLRKILGQNLKIHDSFSDLIRNTCKILDIRGNTGRKA